jgi:hypothetical protein
MASADPFRLSSSQSSTIRITPLSDIRLNIIDSLENFLLLN